MLRIPCPWCGVRDETEFRFGGEAHVERPGLEVSDAEWADYLFNRENPKGLHYERWCHVYGCSQWFNVVRDTVTHEIYAVYEMGEAKPDIKMTDRG
ncbi:MAG: sarcosine oxidase subunit delta [Proteobacteria bacterium]|nr:sarcosine oxidase subunit delta [Pseudomonadota bacterium]